MGEHGGDECGPRLDTRTSGELGIEIDREPATNLYADLPRPEQRHSPLPHMRPRRLLLATDAQRPNGHSSMSDKPSAPHSTTATGPGGGVTPTKASGSVLR